MTPLGTPRNPAIPGLSPVAVGALARAGFKTLEEAAAWPDAELLGLKGFKEGSLQRLRAWAAGAEQPPVKKYGRLAAGAEKSRGERIWDAYLQLVGRGEPDAYRMAVEAVEDFERQAGGAP